MNLLSSLILCLWIGSEAWLSLTRRSKIGATSKDRYSLLLIWIVNLSAIALGIVAARRLPDWQLPRPNIWFVIGLCVLALGLSLRWYTVYYLGSSFTTKVAIAPDQRLIDTGPYRWIRHPSYAGALLAVLGFGLHLANAAAVVILVVPAFAVQLWRMHVEENALVAAFGDQYRNYMRRTNRLIPWVY